MKKVKSTTGETIKFTPDVNVLSITPEGVIVSENIASLIESRLGNQVSVEDTDEIAAPEVPVASEDEQKVDEPKTDEAPANVEAGEAKPE